jgi:Ribbon-helix-helix protein, copG family
MCYARLMKRTTIMLPEELDARVRMEARRRGVSIADIAREAIEQFVAPPAPTGHLGFFAVGEGGPPDASERVDEFVGKAIARRRRPRRPA